MSVASALGMSFDKNNVRSMVSVCTVCLKSIDSYIICDEQLIRIAMSCIFPMAGKRGKRKRLLDYCIRKRVSNRGKCASSNYLHWQSRFLPVMVGSVTTINSKYRQ